MYHYKLLNSLGQNQCNNVTIKAGQSITLNPGFTVNSNASLSLVTGFNAVSVKASSREYAAGIEYLNGQVESIYFPDGRVYRSGSTWRYEYVLTDHLGNNRLSFYANGSSAVEIQQTHYYPFGMEMEGVSTVNAANKYKYNGKELNEDFGLNWYDYGARWYDASIGRFSTVDPLAESFSYQSTFAYAGNSPIVNIDILGMAAASFQDIVNDLWERGDGEYEKDENGNWVKVSDVGDKIGVDFYHEDVMSEGGSVQVTKVVDRQGNENYIRGGRSLLGNGNGESRTQSEGGWRELYSEWRWGTGPETSIFEGDHPNNTAIQESNWLQDQISEFSNSNKPKAGPVGFDWDSGITATLQGNNDNMQLVFMGSYSVNFYRMGDRNLVFVLDSKTRESGMGHLPLRNYSRSEGMPYPAPWSSGRSQKMTTTHQRYLFFVDK